MNTRNENQVEHQDVFLLLPWYVNGSIAGDERDRVEAHLAECATCRQEVGFVESVEHAANSRESISAIPRNGFATLMQRIDAEETNHPVRQNQFGAIKAFFSSLVPVQAGWAMAVPALAVALVAGYLVWPGSGDRDPAFETLSSSESPESKPLQLRVELLRSVVEEDARQALISIHAGVAIDRAEDGSYTLTLPQGSTPSIVAKALAELRSNENVVGAELMLKSE